MGDASAIVALGELKREGVARCCGLPLPPTSCRVEPLRGETARHTLLLQERLTV